MNVKMFIFRDPVFSINKKHTLEFANELINRKLGLKFIIETHLKILDNELIQVLKKAGLKGVKVGVESPDIKVLNDANRFTIGKDEQFQKIRELEKNNIQLVIDKLSLPYLEGSVIDYKESMIKSSLFKSFPPNKW